MEMKDIILISHTEAVHHKNGMIGSWTDWELTEKGKTEADNIAKNLYEELKDKDVKIFSSDLRRASMTALPIAKKLGVDINYDKSIREINLGKACGKTAQWYKENAKPRESSIDYKPFNDAESLREFYNRIKSFYENLLKEKEEIIIIIAHGGVASIFPSIIANGDVTALNKVRFFSTSGGVSKYQIRKDLSIIYTISDTSYKKD